MLHALFEKLLTKAKQNDPATPAIGTLTFAQPYGQLRYADVEGLGTVTIDWTGNMIGFSPVERCSANGETAWLPLTLCKNIRMEPGEIIAGTTRGRKTTAPAKT